MRHPAIFLLAILVIIFVGATNGCSKAGPANSEAALDAYVQSTLTAISAADATVDARVQATMEALTPPSPVATATPVLVIPGSENRSLSFAGYHWTVIRI